jgi:3-dehydroquinate synthase
MRINTDFSTVYIALEIESILSEILNEFENKKIFILVDENTKRHCLPIIKSHEKLLNADIIEIGSGESNKTIYTAEKIWQHFISANADRSSLLINLGGGIICDMGGFAASTFKRGMDFINIPTTLLSQVDASIGGKTGVNFNGLKNEIGMFSHPQKVIINSSFIRTLDKRNIMSGWAEMLKHALIFDIKDWKNLISTDIKKTGFKDLNQLIARSINIKKHFVEQDPTEKNIRKALNWGHTFGHAFESFFMNSENKIYHGEAIAHGMICELYLSNIICGFPMKSILEIAEYLLNTYTKLDLQTVDFNSFYELITHDKKKEGAKTNFTLLEDFGKIKINQHCTKKQIIDALNWYRTL